MGSGAATARMRTSGFRLLLHLLLALLSRQTLGLKQCNNCVHINDCRQWCSKIEQGGASKLSLEERAEFNDNICGYLFNVDPPTKMCCDTPAEKNVCSTGKGTPSTTTTTNSDSGPKFEPRIQCGQIQLEEEGQCGGCEDASPGAWPWMTRLLYQANNNLTEKETTYCGGALVSARHVVTAAHCVEDVNLGEPQFVSLGELNVTTEYDCYSSDEEECGGNGEQGKACFEEERCAAKREKYAVSQTFVHPDYRAKTSGKDGKPRFDVAVLLLDRPVRFSTTIQPVCLPPRDPERGGIRRILALTGWGNVVKGFGAEKSATKLQQLMGLQETPLNECRNLVGRVATLEDQHMCVWKPNSGSNGCQGDSGGPVSEVIRKDAYDKGFWELAGVVSFGVHSACASNTPLVVTRVAEPSILNWIKEKVGGDMPVQPK